MSTGTDARGACPACGASFREEVICPRCGADLEAVMRLIAAAYRRRAAARAALLKGELLKAYQYVRQANTLHRTEYGEDLLARVVAANGLIRPER